MTARPWRLGTLLLLGGAALLPLGSAEALPPATPASGMVCLNGSLSGTTRTFDLVANSGTAQTPDGNDIFMWSYSTTAPDYPDFQYPGPVLCAKEGETVQVNLHNTLPEATSIVFPGQDAEVTASGGATGLLTTEADPGADVSYSFTASHPGTYLYESGSDVAKQIEMGLYGALIVRPSLGDDYAYDDAVTRFDPSREYLLLLAEIDPVLHHAVETGKPYDFTTLQNHYFTINGRSFPDTIQDNGTDLLPNQPYGALVRIRPNDPSNDQPALIRMVNAGADNHPFHPHGNHTRQIAQDGRRLLSPGGQPATTEHFAETIGAGQTEDYLLRWDPQGTDSAGIPFNDAWDPGSNPFPVSAPNYRNVTFKDARTWYSGSPYLGYSGTLPTGTTSLSICGEWYFPMHSHALNEFSNFDEGFGGMGTLLRVDPAGGCFTAPGSTKLVGAKLKSGKVGDLAADEPTPAFYQVNPVTTTRKTATTDSQTTGFTVASAGGFPSSGTFYARIDAEVVQVTGGQGTTSWTVARGQLGTAAAAHLSGAVVSALATDWYAGFSGVTAGSSNLRVTYKGANCATTTLSTCAALTTNLPQQTVSICDWTIAGANGCATATSSGWVQLPGPPAQPIAVGSTQVSSTWSLPGPADHYIGTGTQRGQVRVLVHTQRWTSADPTPFSTWGNLMKLVYDAP
jgi:hypothetical protein